MTIAVKKHAKLDKKLLKSCPTLPDFSTLYQIFCPGLQLIKLNQDIHGRKTRGNKNINKSQIIQYNKEKNMLTYWRSQKIFRTWLMETLMVIFFFKKSQKLSISISRNITSKSVMWVITFGRTFPSTFIWITPLIDSLFLSYHIHVLEWIYTLQLP